MLPRDFGLDTPALHAAQYAFNYTEPEYLKIPAAIAAYQFAIDAKRFDPHFGHSGAYRYPSALEVRAFLDTLTSNADCARLSG